MDLPPVSKQEKIKLTEINQYLVCSLCKGYLIDATTISECLHSFCRSCFIKFLQENSFCPVCKLVINKAKPNLKLDKTLQDIVYKLVPELFLKEMLRRKTFFKDKPEIASRVPPEERGEDTERTIFNPRETISLSLEYICDDSSPGAIRIPGILTDPESLKNNGTIDVSEESQMKRYLLCPGMCRVEVLKKFVRNKYNVDTNQFFIDILYKRVPLPDHYTLIDIAYIYSWQRNELMKFFFRILDKNKPRNTDSPVNVLPQFIPRHFRKRSTRKERKSMSAKVVNTPAKPSEEASMERVSSSFPQNIIENELAEAAIKKGKEIVNVKFEKCSDTTAKEESEKILQETEFKESDKPSVPPIRFKEEKLLANNISIKKEPLSPSEAQKADDKLLVKMSEEFLNSSKISSKSPSIYSQSVTKSYTSITLNRSENVEIITKIEPLSNEDGHPMIGHHIIKQTIKKGSKIKSPRKISPKSSQVTIPRLALFEKPIKRKSPPKMVKNETFIKDDFSEYNFEPDEEDEKTVFFNYIKLAPTNQVFQKHVNKSRKHLLLNKPLGGQKRKHSSPVKNDKNKVPKLDAKKSVKLILQDKPEANNKSNKNLQSTINSFKIPSSLSITIKESSEKHNASPIAPPVKNYIEILKIPEEGSSTGLNEEKKSAEPPALCDNDSEQKVDQELSDIAKSLTEKIPMTTTISQLFSPKQPFKPNIPSSNNNNNNAQILPSPVPELSKSVISGTQNSTKLNPRTPQQTFQKIFEESLKKTPEGGAKTSAVEIVQESTNKKIIPEIAAAPLEKKMKLEPPVEEPIIKSPILPKVQIPRLPPKSQKLPPMVPQTIANLHSTSLGLNYTVSVGQQSPSKLMKSNGTISPKAESIPLEIKSPESAQKTVKSEFKVPSPNNNRISPKASSSSETKPKSPSQTKNSPKSSPLVKHMYGSSNNQSRLPPTTSPSPSPSSSSLSPNSNITPSSPLNNSMELLDKYNIQNLAQLSASFNLNPAILANNNNQLAAMQHAMLLQHFDIQNRQNWLSRNQGPLLQYEKYLQSLNGSLSGSQGKT